LHGLFYLGFWFWMSPGAGDEEDGNGLLRAIRTLFTFHLVCFAWIFFRATSLTDAWTVVGKIGAAIISGPPNWIGWQMLLLAAAFCILEWLQRRRVHAFDVIRWSPFARWSFYYVTVLIIIGYANLQYVPFIYFDF
jgi:hypothetical protein